MLHLVAHAVRIELELGVPPERGILPTPAFGTFDVDVFAVFVAPVGDSAFDSRDEEVTSIFEREIEFDVHLDPLSVAIHTHILHFVRLVVENDRGISFARPDRDPAGDADVLARRLRSDDEVLEAPVVQLV